MTTSSSHNASASIFGWEFQVNAAMVLFIRWLPDVGSIKAEGLHEDIEINFVDGSCILCQAKAHFGNTPGEGSTGRFNDALKALGADCKVEGCRACLFVTNDSLPFGKSKVGNYFGQGEVLGAHDVSA